MIVQTNQLMEQNGDLGGLESSETDSCGHVKSRYNRSGTTNQQEGTELTIQRERKPGISPIPRTKGASQVN